nr:uncharacterized protein LOC128689688 [Cherax quadricarinatus]
MSGQPWNTPIWGSRKNSPRVPASKQLYPRHLDWSSVGPGVEVTHTVNNAALSSSQDFRLANFMGLKNYLGGLNWDVLTMDQSSRCNLVHSLPLNLSSIDT